MDKPWESPEKLHAGNIGAHDRSAIEWTRKRPGVENYGIVQC